jgi:hypothetical protein
MSQRALTASIAAGGTAALVPAIPAFGPINNLGPLGKMLLGGATAWFTYSMTGMTGAVGIGVGIGLAIDGLVDLTVGPAVQNVSA